MSDVTRLTFAALKEHLLGVMAAENNRGFFRDGADIAPSINEGMRLQDEFVRQQLRKNSRDGTLGGQAHHAYLQRFVTKLDCRVREETTKLVWRETELLVPVLSAATAGGSLTGSSSYRAHVVHRDPLTGEQLRAIGTLGSTPAIATTPVNKKIPFSIGPDQNWKERFTLLDVYRWKGGGNTFYLEETISAGNLDDVAATGFLDKADTALGRELEFYAGPDLRDRDMLLVQALDAPAVESMTFKLVPPSEIPLAKRVPSRRPTSALGFYTRTGEQAEYDLFFPTRNLTAPCDVLVEVLYLKQLDDYGLFTDNPATVCPIDVRFMAAPLQWAAARMMERQQQPPDLYEERFQALIKLIP